MCQIKEILEYDKTFDGKDEIYVDFINSKVILVASTLKIFKLLPNDLENYLCIKIYVSFENDKLKR